jgi:transposase
MGTQRSRARPRALSARQATWLLLRSVASLSDEERRLRQRVLTTPTIQAAFTAVEAFRVMVGTRDRTALDSWLTDAETSVVPERRTFAASVRRDYAAIAAALELPWSSGQVEGHVTKIKLRKREMYGRGKLDLLRRRVLLAS